MKSLKLIFVLGLICGVAFVVHAWLAARRDAEALKQTLAAQNKVLSGADADKRANDSNLQKALQQIDALKRKVRTPAAAVQGLNQSLQLPAPIVLSSADGPSNEPVGGSGVGGEGAMQLSGLRRSASGPGSRADTDSEADSLPSRPNAKIAASGISAILPGADLIPLYRYTLDCQTCSVELAAANANAVEEQKKIAALEAERDAALKVSRNGNFRHRIMEAATWFALGGGVGATLTTARMARSAIH